MGSISSIEVLRDPYQITRHVVYLLETHNLFSEDGTFTMPDGTVYVREDVGLADRQIGDIPLSALLD